MIRFALALGLACLGAPLSAQQATAPPVQSEGCQPDDSVPDGNVTGFADETGLPCLPFSAARAVYESFPVQEGPFARTLAATGRLDVVTDAGLVSCTAVAVAPRLVATDAACIPGVLDNPAIGTTLIVGVRLHLDFYYPAQPLWMVDSHNLSREPAFTDGALTLLSLVPDALPFPEWRIAPLAPEAPDRYAPLVLLGHPIGSPLLVSEIGCFADAQPVEARAEGTFGHTCATLSGVTGAPLFDPAQGGVAGLHSTQDAESALRTARLLDALRAHLTAE